MTRGIRFFWPVLAVLSPIFPLTLYFWGNFYDIAEPFSLAMVFGIFAYVYFLNVLIMSSRIHYFDRLFGHDRVMRFHGYLAFTALLFAVVHRQLKVSVFPFSTFQTQFGQWALIVFLALIFLTLFVMVPGVLHRIRFYARFRSFLMKKLRLDYNLLKGIHNGLVLAALLLSFHVFFASSTQESWWRMSLMGGWAGAALILWVRHKIIKPISLRRKGFTVTEVLPLKDDIVEVRIRPDAVGPEADKGALNYTAGQFAFVRFPGSPVGSEEHPFTFSSAPDEPHLAITAKALGNYTSRLKDLSPGSRVSVDGPYGIFTLRSAGKRPAVFIAGGIGITPILSMLKTLKKEDDREFLVFWAVQKRADLVYGNEIKAVAGRLPSMRYVPVLSDDAPGPKEEGGFLTVETMRKYMNRDPGEYRYYFCGPPKMRDFVFKGLRETGVKRRDIRYEMFSL